MIGFLANGIAYMIGDNEVGRAFDSVHHETDVADASRDLKAGRVDDTRRGDGIRRAPFR